MTTVMIVTDAPSETDQKEGQLLVGTSGVELTKMLLQVGIDRRHCHITSLLPSFPKGGNIENYFYTKTAGQKLHAPLLHSRYCDPIIAAGVQRLREAISRIKPNIVITLGSAAMWALTGNTSIQKWHGSQLLIPNLGIKMLPTYHPSQILRQWYLRNIMVNDLRRAARESLTPELKTPDYKFLIRASFADTMKVLNDLISRADTSPSPVRIAHDLETRLGHIACSGIAWSPTEAICIPHMCVENRDGYWSLAEEKEIVLAQRRLLSHSNVQVVGQNYMYDAQYTARWWGVIGNVYMDTMIAHHLCFTDMQKSLDFLSSLYCHYHCYWKDEGKEWRLDMNEDQLWSYNCKDAVTTFEISTVLEQNIDKMSLTRQWEFQKRLFLPILHSMLRGIKFAKHTRNEYAELVLNKMNEHTAWFERIMPDTVAPRKKGTSSFYNSPQQLAGIFYDRLKIPPVLHRKTKKRTTEDEALPVIAKREPLLKPFVDRLSNYRSLGVVYKNNVCMAIDHDGRARCSYNQAGTITFRLSSSSDAFNFGTNLQNVTSGDEEAGIPNMRRLFIPDNDHVIIDVDLDRADAQVVAWDSGDEALIQAFTEGIDIHTLNASDIFSVPFGSVTKAQRQFAKKFVHATNYGASATRVAQSIGITTHEAEKAQARWFSAHPAIEAWQKNIANEVMEKRSLTNIFGFRWIILDRISQNVINEALAWKPQSTVGLIINMAWANIAENLAGKVEVLLQVHDSLVMQFHKSLYPSILPEIRKNMLIEIPYPRPLVIPVGVKSSVLSWGDVKDDKWEH